MALPIASFDDPPVVTGARGRRLHWWRRDKLTGQCGKRNNGLRIRLRGGSAMDDHDVVPVFFRPTAPVSAHSTLVDRGYQ